jgi:hypothetical protein
MCSVLDITSTENQEPWPQPPSLQPEHPQSTASGFACVTFPVLQSQPVAFCLAAFRFNAVEKSLSVYWLSGEEDSWES